jgi:N-acyl homoserine lactone hydrolase
MNDYDQHNSTATLFRRRNSSSDDNTMNWRRADIHALPPYAHRDYPVPRYRQVDGDTELLPSLTLIETSGHAPGHQSVLVRLPQTGPVLLTIDAVVLQRLFIPDRAAWPLDDNEEQLRASTRKLLDLVEREHVALVIFDHDGKPWQMLKKPPAFYA